MGKMSEWIGDFLEGIDVPTIPTTEAKLGELRDQLAIELDAHRGMSNEALDARVEKLEELEALFKKLQIKVWEVLIAMGAVSGAGAIITAGVALNEKMQGGEPLATIATGTAITALFDVVIAGNALFERLVSEAHVRREVEKTARGEIDTIP